MAIRIICINKSGGFHNNPHEAISYLGWINEQTGAKGKSSRIEVYDWIKNNGGIAYVLDKFGNKAYLETVISVRGTKFVRTIADGKPTDNLLYLPECVV